MDKQFFGAFLDLSKRLCVVIGGGKVAERKVQSLLLCEARVRIVSPTLTPALAELVSEGRIEYVERSFQSGDTKGAFLTVAATNSPEVNRLVVQEAEADGRLVNSVHASTRGNTIFPAVVRRGPLQVAISTSGTGPAVARAVREELENYFDTEYELYLHKVSSIRNMLMKTIEDEAVRAEIIREIVQSNVRELLRSGNEAEADRTIRVIIEGRRNS
ncbi:precorrin-2 dehydrogenase/sirohydrochlorin ferrochelatase family protein [Effusibacillus consociatus]|uniref:precorrin-2 dehydrogenase n=1 Tax=Effusibacillus consociatus TaxID=1117041 RepID=A0ABV9Q279_9BACL